MAYLLAQALLAPLIAVPIAYAAGARIGSKAGWISFASLAYSTLLMGMAALQGGVLELYDWRPLGFFGLNADGLSIPIVFTISLLSTLISIYSMPYMEHRIGDRREQHGLYHALYLLYAIGMMGTTLATNLIEFYLFFELMLIPSYFLIAQWGYGDRERISFMYFMWTHVGALALLAGILSVWYLSGGVLDLQAIRAGAIPEQFRAWVAVAMLVGFLVKMAAFGLHIWLPYAHAEAPTPISALLSPAMIGIGGYAVVRIIMSILPSAFELIAPAVAVWALITMVYGGAMALVQDDLKRLLAYSSISQMGYILLGISSFQLLGISGSMFHYFSHGAGKGILFMAAGAIILQAHGLRSISRLGGLASRMPITAMAATMGFLTILGAPPMSGFISEILIFLGAFRSALQAGSLGRLIVAVLAVASTALTAGYSLWTIRRVFFGPLPSELRGVEEAPPTVTVPLMVLVVASVLAGIFPDIVMRFLIPGVRAIVGG